jgi:hypothetical protein
MKLLRMWMWAGVMAATVAWQGWAAEDVINIGGRRELFVDDAMVSTISGGLRMVLHRPERKEIVLETDRPWEGNASAFQSVMFVDGKYRMYYRGIHYTKNMGVSDTTLPDHPWMLCYAESTDGIHWTRPNLGICEFQKSKENNIILDPAMVKEVGGDPAHTSVFYDTNPACPPDQRYKINLTSFAKRPVPGMYIMASADGIHFKLLSDKASVTGGAFDSQNLIFWDPVAKTYRAYYRNFRNGIRDIMTSSSTDILRFPLGKQVARRQGKDHALYTNQMQPYYRAPHIILGFPMRYYDRGKVSWEWPAMSALPNIANRKSRSATSNRHGTAVTDAILLASRDGETVRLWEEAFMRPGPRQNESWTYGDNFIFWGLVETASHLGDAPNEISFYSTEGYWQGNSTKFRRSTLRLDGFVSAQAPATGGELITKPLIFAGSALSINFETGGPGEVKVEIQNPDGTPVPGYALADCFPIFGDHIDFFVSWKGKGTDVSALAGKPVRIRFALKDADLYAFQFLPQ